MRLINLSKFLFLAAVILTAVSVDAQKKPVAAKPAARVLTVVTEPNATVWLDEVRRGATDETGRLKIEKVAAGTRKLRIRAFGFAEKSQNILPTQRGEIKIPLLKTTDEAILAYQEAENLRETNKDTEREKSVKIYRRALELRSNFPAAHVGLARVLADLNEYDAALEEIVEARKDNPNFAEASVVEGRIYRAEIVAEYDNSIKSFRRAIRESKNTLPEAHSGLALAFKDKGDYEAAVVEFKTALVQYADTDPILYQFLGDTYERMKRPKDAIAAYQKFLLLAPNHSQASAVRSIIEQLKKSTDDDSIELLPQ